uniref:SERPIN domain-containing protein n=1 Tax=Caenorhabditis tropicalis TaxID=1561998 RepID=A0A1I7TVG9_9PELO
MSSEVQGALLRSEIEFGLNVLRQQNLDKSFVFSPASISFGLSLVHAAASGDTQSEIRDVLLRGSTDEQLENHMSNLLKQISKTMSKSTKIKVVNHAFCWDVYPIKEDYLKEINRLYNAGATPLDFIRKKKDSADAINKFIEENTEGLIKSNLTEKYIKEYLVVVYTNTIYFKARWLEQFFAHSTEKFDFHLSPESKRSIDFLQTHGHRSYSENEQFQVLHLRYLDKSFAMSIFLPKTRFGLKDALIKLTPSTILKLLSTETSKYMMIKIPKWKIESSIDLEKTLKALGVVRSFDIFNPDFTKLADDLHGLTKMDHLATIEVNEQGTTAAAATILRLRGGGIPPEPIDFTADHPFLFIITKDMHPIFVGLHY